MYGKGISREGSLIDVAVDLGIVKKSGAWYTYEGEQLGQGRENAKAFIAENLEVMIEISEKVRQQVGLGRAPGDVPLGADPSDDEPISPRRLTSDPQSAPGRAGPGRPDQRVARRQHLHLTVVPLPSPAATSSAPSAAR